MVFMSYNDADHNQFGNNGYQKIDRWGDRRVYYNASPDDGETWGSLRNMATELLPFGYTWDAMGPGNGIQLSGGAKPGRLIIPAIGRNIYIPKPTPNNPEGAKVAKNGLHTPIYTLRPAFAHPKPAFIHSETNPEQP